MRTETTIVALATPPGAGGLSVIRLSGPDALAIAAKVFRGPGFSANPVPRRAVYGILFARDNALPVADNGVYAIDQAVALPFFGPYSYTGEDTVEFSCHGSPVVVQAALAAFREAGAEPALAGEFTRRAFLNGKLSLDQAEAVADLIQAQSEQSARAAVRQLLGGLDDQLRSIEEPLLDLLARLEGSLEFADDEDVGVPREQVREVLDGAVVRLDKLVKMAPAGRLLREGIHIVLAGPPNVGKSSLFNALLSDERAIVDDEAGTTRDVITGRVARGGSVFVLHDTAGLRRDPGRVEQMGIERTWRQVAEADIVLSLIEVGSGAVEVPLTGEAPRISVVTKCDLSPDAAVAPGAVMLSVTTGTGVGDLWRAIDEVVAGFALKEAVALGVVLNERHLHKLAACRTDIERLRAEVESGAVGDEIIGTLLASILSGLGEVSGRVFAEHLLESVFNRFCVGK